LIPDARIPNGLEIPKGAIETTFFGPGPDRILLATHSNAWSRLPRGLKVKPLAARWRSNSQLCPSISSVCVLV
jgi:hypothetical protein